MKVLAEALLSLGPVVQVQLEKEVQEAFPFLQSLGGVINREKCNLMSTNILYLGYRVESISQKVFPMEDKIQRVREMSALV